MKNTIKDTRTEKFYEEKARFENLSHNELIEETFLLRLQLNFLINRFYNSGLDISTMNNIEKHIPDEHLKNPLIDIYHKEKQKIEAVAVEIEANITNNVSESELKVDDFKKIEKKMLKIIKKLVSSTSNYNKNDLEEKFYNYCIDYIKDDLELVKNNKKKLKKNITYYFSEFLSEKVTEIIKSNTLTYDYEIKEEFYDYCMYSWNFNDYEEKIKFFKNKEEIDTRIFLLFSDFLRYREYK